MKTRIQFDKERSMRGVPDSPLRRTVGAVGTPSSARGNGSQVRELTSLVDDLRRENASLKQKTRKQTVKINALEEKIRRKGKGGRPKSSGATKRGGGMRKSGRPPRPRSAPGAGGADVVDRALESLQNGAPNARVRELVSALRQKIQASDDRCKQVNIYSDIYSCAGHSSLTPHLVPSFSLSPSPALSLTR